MEMEPPFEDLYKALSNKRSSINYDQSLLKPKDDVIVTESVELPLIDLDRLNSGQLEYENCLNDMAEAATRWGFFQLINHGIPEDVLKRIIHEQKKLFHQPFSNKSQPNFLNLSANSYRWGNPKATSLTQFHWSEAFHMSISDISRIDQYHFSSLRKTIEEYSVKVDNLAQRISELLATKLSSIKSSYFRDNCLLPHTDSDFLTIVYQDRVGGLQLKRDNGSWVSVKPSTNVLSVNIGDLFQALSNGVYKSIEHRVIAPQKVERLSIAYFLCPSHDVIIQSCSNKPPIYKNFSFKEYTLQIQRDVDSIGDKIGLSRFLF
ncbi:gibberellin 2-beta-dioxygenase 8-like isoform X2 [Carica papaya]|uniref:gibberellin 2-beta-dioxygenase 8-like isoform X2 n=1 Tax=Carica papaya TaxID=3649 RepID=UPI000B8C996C|nr:gibberellin 2-beta-dioxygenase 8-like isoform X2 [Carica papaya]